MSNTLYSRLTHLDVIRIHGPDALKFLQGQCTQDVASMTSDSPRHGAFCTPKGRAVTNCWLHALSKDDVYLICHHESAPVLAKHLQKYIAFFRTTALTYQPGEYQLIGVHDNTHHWPTAFNENAFAVPWGQSRTLFCFRSASDQMPVIDNWLKPLQEAPLSAWQAEDIRQQRLWLDSKQVEQWIPQNFSLDTLDGISFKKGCYTGQEVIARLHYKGKSKKQLFKLTWNDTPADTLHIYQEGKAVGDVLNQVETEDGFIALAILTTNAVDAPLWLDEGEQFPAQLLH